VAKRPNSSTPSTLPGTPLGLLGGTQAQALAIRTLRKAPPLYEWGKCALTTREK